MNLSFGQAKVGAAEKEKAKETPDLKPGVATPRPLEPGTEIQSPTQQARGCACATPECVLM